jgi:hypothetical protein
MSGAGLAHQCTTACKHDLSELKVGSVQHTEGQKVVERKSLIKRSASAENRSGGFGEKGGSAVDAKSAPTDTGRGSPSSAATGNPSGAYRPPAPEFRPGRDPMAERGGDFVAGGFGNGSRPGGEPAYRRGEAFGVAQASANPDARAADTRGARNPADRLPADAIGLGSYKGSVASPPNTPSSVTGGSTSSSVEGARAVSQSQSATVGGTERSDHAGSRASSTPANAPAVASDPVVSRSLARSELPVKADTPNRFGVTAAQEAEAWKLIAPYLRTEPVALTTSERSGAGRSLDVGDSRIVTAEKRGVERESPSGERKRAPAEQSPATDAPRTPKERSPEPNISLNEPLSSRFQTESRVVQQVAPQPSRPPYQSATTSPGVQYSSPRESGGPNPRASAAEAPRGDPPASRAVTTNAEPSPRAKTYEAVSPGQDRALSSRIEVRRQEFSVRSETGSAAPTTPASGLRGQAGGTPNQALPTRAGAPPLMSGGEISSKMTNVTTRNGAGGGAAAQRSDVRNGTSRRPESTRSDLNARSRPERTVTRSLERGERRSSGKVSGVSQERARLRDPSSKPSRARVDSSRRVARAQARIDDQLPAFIRQVVSRSVKRAVADALSELERELDFALRVRGDLSVARRGPRRMRNVSEFLRRRLEKAAKRKSIGEQSQPTAAPESGVSSKTRKGEAPVQLKKGKQAASKSLDMFTAESDDSGANAPTAK